MNARVAQQGQERRDILLLGAAALLVVSLYFAVASENREAYRAKPVTYNHYNLLVDGFLSGHLYMDLAPDPSAVRDGQVLPLYSARVHDTSLYRGRYYLYFGAVPAVVLFLPWKVLTGAHLAQYWAAAIFASLGYLASLALLARLRREHFPWLDGGVLFASAFLLGLVNWWPILLCRVGMWEVPIASAYGFSMLALLCAHAAAGGPRTASWLGAASLSYALAIGSRPNFIFGTAVLALPLVYLWRAERAAPAGRAEWTKRVLALGLPLAGVGLLLAAYNALRFGNPLELGTSYMVLYSPEPTKPFSLSYAWTNAYLYFLAPAHLSPWFPFFRVPRLPVVPSGYTSDPEEMYGVLANMPVLLLCAGGAALARSRGAAAGLGLAAASLAALFATVCGVLILYCGTNSRYTVDAMCGLPVLMVLGLWALESWARAGPVRRAAARILWGGLAAASVFFVGCAAIARYEVFRTVHPRAYRAIAHALDLPSFWYDRLHDVAYGPVDLVVRFPGEKAGRNEPLVVTGWRPWTNALYVHYTDATHIQFGFLGPAGPTLGPPFEIDYGRPHTLRISMGSFYPPREHPFYDSLSRQDADALSGTLFVAVDGATVLHQRAYFFDGAARKPGVGLGPPVQGRDWVFTGDLRQGQGPL